MAAVFVSSLVLCGAFVALTRLALGVPAIHLRSVLAGFAFFLAPMALTSPAFAGLWALALAGAWAVRNPAPAVPPRPTGVRIPDRLPEDWSTDDPYA
ncbi:MAG: hypothetical protein ACHQNA_08975 [Acidimicrobiales bacterium]